MTARTHALAAIACLTLSVVVTQARAQTFPSKPVRIVVAYPRAARSTTSRAR